MARVPAICEFGTVYSGMIDVSGIKCLKCRHTVKIRSMLRHRHFVPVIGSCDEDEMTQVYGYRVHGSLREHLFETQLTT
jgi:hypothetical protein